MNNMTITDKRTITQCPMKTGNNWGTGCIIINKKGELLVGKRTDTHDYCTPGGKVEIGETVEQGMKREIKEESNLTVKSYDFYEAHVGAYKNNKVWISYMFICKDFSGDIKPQETEIESWNWMPISEVKKLNLFPPTERSLIIAGERGLIKY